MTAAPWSRLAGAIALFAAVPALAQLTPDRTYYGIDRAIPMTVKAPAGHSGDLSIQLFATGATEPGATASVVAGGVDLAGLFPSLWRPEGDAPVLMYAQLLVGSTKVGAPVVLQPLVEPPYAVRTNDPPVGQGEPVYRPSEGPYNGLRAYTDRHAVLETSLGTIEFALRPDQAPNTVWNFRELVAGGFYTDVAFHRIVLKRPDNQLPFVIQAGDPTGTGDGGPGFSIDLEQSKLQHDFGVLSMARARDPNSGGSQFFVCLSRAGTAPLDGRYTSFGQAVKGGEVIQAIAATELDEGGAPKEPPVIRKAYLVDAPPFGEGAAPVTAPPAEGIER